MAKRQSVGALQKKIDEVEGRGKCDCGGKCGDNCKCKSKSKRPPSYHNTHTYVIRSEHESGSGSDDIPVSYYVNLAYQTLQDSGMKGGVQNRNSVDIRKGTHKGEQGVFLDLPTKKRRLFFPKVTHISVIWDLVDGLITQR